MAKNTAPNTATVEQTAPVQNTATETSNESTQTLDSSSEGSESVVDPKEIFKTFLHKMLIPDEGASNSPFLNKSVYGGKTLDIILLIRADGTPVPMQRVGGTPSDHAAALITVNGVPKHTFLTKAEYLLIASTAKPCDLPAADAVVDKYHEFLEDTCDPATRAYAATRLRMSLTADGNVKAA